MRRKILAGVFCAVVLVSCLFVPVAATDKEASKQEIEFIFQDDVSLELQQLIIADFLGEAPVAKASILCLFGHKLETGTMEAIQHKVRATSPRCLSEIYTYEICTRNSCDYSKYTKISSGYTNCCS